MAAGGVLHYIAAMKTLTYFTAAIIGTLLAAALLAYPVYLGVHALNPDWAFHRIASRLWLVLVVAATWVLGRRLALSRADFGFGVSRPRFRREVGIGFLAGILSMLPVAAMRLAANATGLASVSCSTRRMPAPVPRCRKSPPAVPRA